MNIHACTVFSERNTNSQLERLILTYNKMPPVHWKNVYTYVLCCVYLTNLEFIGDKGGEVGAGVSASSSSSSPHSSSLRGVMLLPNHTEWMETWRMTCQVKKNKTYLFITVALLTTHTLFLKSSITVYSFLCFPPAPVCIPCCPSPSLCWSEGAVSHGWSAYLLKQISQAVTLQIHFKKWLRLMRVWLHFFCYLQKLLIVRAQDPRHGMGGMYGRCPFLTQALESLSPPRL